MSNVQSRFIITTIFIATFLTLSPFIIPILLVSPTEHNIGSSTIAHKLFQIF